MLTVRRSLRALLQLWWPPQWGSPKAASGTVALDRSMGMAETSLAWPLVRG